MSRNIFGNIFSPHSSFWDKCREVIILLAMLIIISPVLLIVFILVDSVGITPIKTATTVVETKQVVPAYTTTLLVGRINIPQYHPESYQLNFKVDGEQISAVVEKELFDVISVGDKIEVDYGFGRLSNSNYQKEIRLVGKSTQSHFKASMIAILP